MSLKLSATVDNAEKHECDVTSLIFKNNKVYSAADDGKIKMWNIDLKLEKEIQAHPSSIFSITADDKNRIYSCSNDGSIRVWNADTLEQDGVIQETGEQEMWKVYWADNILATVNDRGIITLYENGKRTADIEMLEQIKDIAFKDKLLYSVRDLDLVITEMLKSEKGSYHMTRITLPGRAPLILIEEYLCYSSRNARDIIINHNKINQFKEITTIKDAHEMVINALSGDQRGGDTILFSGGWDKNVKQWLLKPDGATAAGVCEVGGCVNTLCVNDDCHLVFAGGADGKVWRLDAH